jgi:hypothetical protein
MTRHQLDRRTVKLSPSNAGDVVPGRVTLTATLHPVQRMARYLEATVGELTFDEHRITMMCGERLTTVALDKPFVVRVSAFILPHDRAEVSVAIANRRDAAYRARPEDTVHFKCELPQRRIALHLAAAWVDAPYMKAEDFDRLWRALDRASAEDLTLSVC